MTEDVRAGRVSEVSSDVRIRRAAALLPTVPLVAIEVVDARTLPTVLQTDVHGACAFIMKGVKRINVLPPVPAIRTLRRACSLRCSSRPSSSTRWRI